MPSAHISTDILGIFGREFACSSRRCRAQIFVRDRPAGGMSQCLRRRRQQRVACSRIDRVHTGTCPCAAVHNGSGRRGAGTGRLGHAARSRPRRRCAAAANFVSGVRGHGRCLLKLTLWDDTVYLNNPLLATSALSIAGDPVTAAWPEGESEVRISTPDATGALPMCAGGTGAGSEFRRFGGLSHAAFARHIG